MDDITSFKASQETDRERSYEYRSEANVWKIVTTSERVRDSNAWEGREHESYSTIDRGERSRDFRDGCQGKIIVIESAVEDSWIKSSIIESLRSIDSIQRGFIEVVDCYYWVEWRNRWFNREGSECWVGTHECYERVWVEKGRDCRVEGRCECNYWRVRCEAQQLEEYCEREIRLAAK